MMNDKPLYPMPWWAMNEQSMRCDFFSSDEFIIRFVGTDCEGNALFSVRRRRGPCEPPRNPCVQPRGCR